MTSGTCKARPLESLTGLSCPPGSGLRALICDEDLSTRRPSSETSGGRKAPRWVGRLFLTWLGLCLGVEFDQHITVKQLDCNVSSNLRKVHLNAKLEPGAREV